MFSFLSRLHLILINHNISVLMKLYKDMKRGFPVEISKERFYYQQLKTTVVEIFLTFAYRYDFIWMATVMLLYNDFTIKSCV